MKSYVFQVLLLPWAISYILIRESRLHVVCGVHADAILTYVYDTRDVSAGEWIARERRCRRAVSILEFEKYEAMQARKRLERLWALASRIRDLIQESGMTDNIPRITRGRDSPQGSTEIAPKDLTFLYNMGKSFFFLF